METTKIKPEEIIEKVCQITNISKVEIFNDNRKRKFSYPRMCISQLIHDKYPQLTETKVGEFISRHPATVHHHYEMVSYCGIENARKMYEELKRQIV